MKTQLRNLTVSLLGALVLFGCSEQSTTTGPDESEAPILPPAQSLAFDMSFFDNDQNRQILADTEQGRMGAYDTHWHWLQAVGRVIIINASVAEAMFAPHLAFALAIHTVPSDLGDNTWMWIYTWVDPDGREVQIRLRK